MISATPAADLIGYLAGFTTLISTVPQLVANFRKPGIAASQSAWRNALQAAGNLLWLLYALVVDATPMILFASTGLFLAICLCLQVVRSQPPQAK